MRTDDSRMAYQNLGNENILLFIKAFKSVVEKEYSISHLRKIGLKASWREDELEMKYQCDIQLALKFLEHLQKKEPFDSQLAKLTIADLLPIVSTLNKDLFRDWELWSTNTQASFVYFHQSENLFWKHSLMETKSGPYETNLLSVYALRLSLESRIKGIMGILRVEKKVNTFWQSVGLEDLIKTAKSLTEVKYDSGVNFDEIILLNKWLNAFIHPSMRPFPWLIYQAIEILKPLFESKREQEDRQFSVYSSTKVVSIERLKNEVELALEKKLGEVHIEWRHHLEVMIVSKTQD